MERIFLLESVFRFVNYLYIFNDHISIYKIDIYIYSYLILIDDLYILIYLREFNFI